MGIDRSAAVGIDRTTAVEIDRTTAVVHVTTGICVMEVSVEE